MSCDLMKVACGTQGGCCPCSQPLATTRGQRSVYSTPGRPRCFKLPAMSAVAVGIAQSVQPDTGGLQVPPRHMTCLPPPTHTFCTPAHFVVALRLNHEAIAMATETQVSTILVVIGNGMAWQNTKRFYTGGAPFTHWNMLT